MLTTMQEVSMANFPEPRVRLYHLTWQLIFLEKGKGTYHYILVNTSTKTLDKLGERMGVRWGVMPRTFGWQGSQCGKVQVHGAAICWRRMQ